MKNRKWLWGMAAVLPLAGLPLIAQETPPAPAAQPAPPPASEAKSADAKPAAAEEAKDEAPEAAATEDQRPADERLSADNNISFPVDI